MKTKTESQVFNVGTGILTWNRDERVSDRYGTVRLAVEVDGKRTDIPLAKDCVDKHGSLVAVVMETRKSEHIGDLFHGIAPRTPHVGQRITLGTGTVFFEDNMIGVEPDDGRDAQWLDMRALYDAIDQTVHLTFEEDQQEATA